MGHTQTTTLSAAKNIQNQKQIKLKKKNQNIIPGARKRLHKNFVCAATFSINIKVADQWPATHTDANEITHTRVGRRSKAIIKAYF